MTKYKKYRIKVRGISWVLYEKQDNGYTKLYMVNDGEEKSHLHGVDIDSCLQYIWAYANDRNAKRISKEDLTLVDEFEKEEERLA